MENQLLALLDLWENHQETLQSYLSMMRCDCCYQTMCEPMALSNCDHNVCRRHIHADKCPKCSTSFDDEPIFNRSIFLLIERFKIFEQFLN